MGVGILSNNLGPPAIVFDTGAGPNMVGIYPIIYNGSASIHVIHNTSLTSASDGPVQVISKIMWFVLQDELHVRACPFWRCKQPCRTVTRRSIVIDIFFKGKLQVKSCIVRIWFFMFANISRNSPLSGILPSLHTGIDADTYTRIRTGQQQIGLSCFQGRSASRFSQNQKLLYPSRPAALNLSKSIYI